MGATNRSNFHTVVWPRETNGDASPRWNFFLPSSGKIYRYTPHDVHASRAARSPDSRLEVERRLKRQLAGNPDCLHGAERPSADESGVRYARVICGMVDLHQIN